MAERCRKIGIPVEILKEEKEREYREILSRYDIDLVVTHYSTFGVDLATEMSIPVVSFLHNIYCWVPDDVLGEMKRVDQKIDRYIAVSEDVKNYSVYRFNISPEKIATVPNGIDLDRLEEKQNLSILRRADVGFGDADYIFLNVASLTPAKAHLLILATLKEVIAEHPEVKVLCVGEILDQEYGEFVKAQIAAYGLERHIKLVKFVEEIHPYYKMADAFLLPSIIEGWSLSMMEAMAYGLPLILTKVGGAAKVVENNDIGLLVDNRYPDVFGIERSALDNYRNELPPNIPSLKRAMLHFLEEKAYWKEAGLKGKRKVADQFDIRIIVNRYEALFHSVVALNAKAVKNRLSDQRDALLRERDSLLAAQERLSAERDRLLVEQDRFSAERKQFLNVQEGLLKEMSQRIQERGKEIDEIRHLIESRYQQLDKRIEYVLMRLSVKERVKERVYKLLKAVHTLVPKKFREKYRSQYRRFFFDQVFPDRERLVTASPKSPHSDHYRNSIQYEFNPYDHIKLLKNIRVSPIDIDFDVNTIRTAFSFIATIKNESSNIIDFLKSIEEQTLKPNEIMIVDGGSTDNTIELVENYINNSALSIKFMKGSNLNIAQGRNRGIREAKNEFIVFSDAGCKLDRNFCKNLVGSFGLFKDADLIGGISHPFVVSEFAKYYIDDWKNLNWDEFIPSARSLAVRKSLALHIGGFPEYLTLTGEDTLFDINYRRVSSKWIFNKKSMVYWNSPKTEDEAYKVAYIYGKGDGESGVGDFRFYELLSSYKKQGCVNGDPIIVKYFEGFREGRKRRADIEIAKRDVRGVVLILSGVPITDSGGGQRAAQMALEFIRRNYKVVYVNVYPSFEKPLKIYFDTDYSLLELYHFNDFFINEFCDRYHKILNKSLVVMEFPHPLFIPIVDRLKEESREIQIVYDCIDNWNSSLGWTWYTEEKEKEIINKSDILIASAKTLKENLGKKSQKEVHLVPNAVNTYLFNYQKKYSRPPDLPSGKPVVIYTGAMWGGWFDWELLDYCAQELTDCNFVLIGSVPEDRRAEIAKRNRNVFFLGLKPQADLPAYLSHSNVCIIPFKIDNITKYVNPLKVYECIAMLKPVVGTSMDELKDVPYVFLAMSKAEFVENIKKAMTFSLHKDIKGMERLKFDEHVVAEFIQKNNWESRVLGIEKAVLDAKDFSVVGMEELKSRTFKDNPIS